MTRRQLLEDLRRGEVSLADARRAILRNGFEGPPRDQIVLTALTETVPAPEAEVAEATDGVALERLQDELVVSLATALYLEAGEIERDLNFTEMGLDSIVGVEWINHINKQYGIKVPATKVYDYPTIEQLAVYLATMLPPSPAAIAAPVGVAVAPVSPPVRPKVKPLELRPLASVPPVARPEPAASRPAAVSPPGRIAIVGMAGRYPGAADLDGFWENLAHGRNSIREIPRERWDVNDYYDPDPGKPGKVYCKWLGSLDDIDCFDASFFTISPAEAEGMDPQYRIFLEAAHQAFEHAGYSARALSNQKCGVYMGVMNSEYVHLLSKAQTQGLNTGNSHSIAAARISYFLNLKGPAIPIDTACSSSLVATHLACQALRNGEIDMALVGGVTLYLTAASYVGMCAAGMLSPDGQCKTFDNAANGFVPGEGAGALVLKRLEDAERDHDCIHGVILGSGINQDGRTNGITAPSVQSQIELERDVYQRFGIDPATIDYVETHGTGTKLGDPVELEALTTVFRERTKRRNFCGLGSVKSNIGHTSAAAGMAGVQKMLLCFRHRTLVPSLHFKEANTHCDFEDSPFYVNTETKPWHVRDEAPRRAAISSMGFSGTNAHLVIEEYQAPHYAGTATDANGEALGPWPIILSAKNEDRLRQSAHNLRTHLRSRPSRPALRDLAYTLQMGRDAMEQRLGFVAQSADELASKLDRFLAGTSRAGELCQARVPRAKGKLALQPADAALNRTIISEVQRGEYGPLLERWVKGLVFDWTQLHGGEQPYRVSLPTYPFARERHWVAAETPPPAAFRLLEKGEGIWSIDVDDAVGPRRLTAARVADLASSLRTLRDRTDVKVVLLQGDARGFLTEERWDDDAPLGRELTQVLADCDVPLIAVLPCRGVGIDWMLASRCDFLVCAEDLHGEFSAPASGPAAEAARAFWRERFGARVESEVMMPGRVFSGRDLRAAGATCPIVPTADVASRALQLAREMAQAPREALRHLKRHLAGEPAGASAARNGEPALPPTIKTEADAAAEVGAPVEVSGGADVVKFERYGNGVVLLTLQDTASKNTFSPALTQGLADAFARIRQDPSLNVVVVTGYGHYFACGGTRAALDAIQQGQAKFTDVNVSSLPLECEIPVIAAMQGHGIGAGWSLGLFCDHTVFSVESIYHSPYLRYGFTPGAGATRIVPERLGRDLGWETLLSAREFSGAELQARGMAMPVLPRAEVLPAALQWAHRLAAKPRATLVAEKTERCAPLRGQLATVFAGELAMHAQTFVGNDEVRVRIERHFGSGSAQAEPRLTKPSGLTLSTPARALTLATAFPRSSPPLPSRVSLVDPSRPAAQEPARPAARKSRDVLDDLKSAIGGRSDLVPTLNRTGVMLDYLTPTSQAFVDYAAGRDGEVLDIGCAYGVATLAALAKGATVLAVDMEAQHLAILVDRVSDGARSRLRTERGVLPDVDFAAGRFAAIHAARVIHFLRPEAVRLTLRKMLDWLQPGGALFLVSDTPYVGYWKSKASEYENRKASGEAWPCFIDHVARHFSAADTAGAPPVINALDPDVLRRECEAVGFVVERVGFESSSMESDLPAAGAAGREHAGIVARKPIALRAPSAGAVTRRATDASVAAIRSYLTTSLAEALHTEVADIDEETPFIDLGVDSVICVTWVRGINTRYNLTIGATRIYDYPSVREFAVFIQAERSKQGDGSADADGNADEVAPAGSPAPVTPTAPSQPAPAARPHPYGLVLSQVHVFDELVLKSWPVPPPAAGEVTIDVRASAVSFTDTICVRGLYPAPYPFVPGLEVAGVVAAVGAGVRELRVGDEVVALTAGNMGGHAERVNVRVTHAVLKPRNVSFEEACSLPLAFGLAYHALEQRGKLAPREHVLIQTAAGGVGLMALQLARLKGAVIYGTSSRAEKRDLLTRLGVDHVLNYQAPDFVREIRRLSQDRGVDVVLNTLAGEAMRRGLDCLTSAGRYLELATHALATSASPDLSGLRFDQSREVVTFLELLSRADGRAVRDLLETMVAWVEAGRIVPTVSRVYPLERIAEALEFVAKGQHVGKVVISHRAEAREDRGPACIAALEAQRQRAETENPTPAPAREPAGRMPAMSSARSRDRGPDEHRLEGIAIVGMSGRFPQSPTLDAFWANLAAGRDCISEVPASRWSVADFYDPDPKQPGKTCSKWMGVLDDVDRFDPLFFQISPAEARMMDPQQRVFMQSCWSCLEDAAINPLSLSGVNCGVFAGCGTGDYGFGAEREGVIGATGVSPSILPARVSYLLNLKGPSQAVDTACSSSLVAIANACDSLILGNCDLALAGGVLIMTTPGLHVGMSQGGMLSPDGRCFTFDERANGFVPGEGVGVVLLKRLSEAVRDGDNIHGVIKGWGVNQDGKTNGITAPSMNAQAALERTLYDRFKVDPATISLVEAHGTGTRLGDPIEVEALTAAFRASTAGRDFCALGSVKSNIGHLGTGAGVAGLIKVLLALRHRTLPPTLHFEKLNPHIPLEGSPFYVNTTAQAWAAHPDHPRRASVSSFGFSGTNAHVVIEEPPERPPVPGLSIPGLVVLSARTDVALRQAVEGLLGYLSDPASVEWGTLHDVAYTLQVGREAMAERLALRVDSREQLMSRLRAYLAGEPGAGCWRDDVKRHRAAMAEFLADHEPRDVVGQWIRVRDFDALLARWAQGFDFDWDQLYPGPKPRRISLPTYVFARERCWLEASPAVASRAAPPSLPSAPVAASEAELLLLQPTWRPWEETPAGASSAYDRRIVLVGGFATAAMEALAGCAPETEWILLAGETADEAGRFEAAVVRGVEVLQAVLASKLKGPVLVQALVPATGDYAAWSGLSGLLKTARQENPQVVAQVVAIDDLTHASACLQRAARAPQEAQFRFVDGQAEVPALVELEASAGALPMPWKDRGVYLITGGAGGLGLIMAREIVAKVARPTLILVGRSPLDEARRRVVTELAAPGAKVLYREVDVGDATAVEALVASIQTDHGGLHGVIHAAGVIRDNFILKKSAADVRAVLAPKVAGALNLERATRDLALDFLVFFSSGAGVTGNAGQADYATANAFMDGLAARRAERVKSGRTVTINWPLWRDGGMQVDRATEQVIGRTTGMVAMDTAAGLRAFYRALGSSRSQVMVLAGDVARMRAAMGRNDSRPSVAAAADARSLPPDRARLTASTLRELKRMLSDIIELSIDRIEADEPLEHYGIDSVMVTRLNQALGRYIPEVSQTLFFEFPTLGEIADFLVDAFPQETLAWAGSTDEGAPVLRASAPSTVTAPPVALRSPAAESPPSAVRPGPGLQEPIAIIGICGRYAQADSLDEFWANLAAGKDGVTEIPPERWALDGFYQPDPATAVRTGKSYSKWGSFLRGFAEFDPLFFNISPLEALGMDPQERLFLQSAWEVLECAGYTRKRLADSFDRDVGVFAGVTKTGFDQYRADWLRQGEVVTPYTSFGSIANRVSYVLNLKGPSMPIDTMCSSSLTAIHEACEHLRRGDCRLAIAGGVNLYLHPSSYVGLCAQRMLSPDGKCRSFGEGGNGFVPGEGVGAVLLKPLAQALADGDPIQAVIRGTSVNHGGKTNGYTVPNPNAQRDVIRAALDKAGIDARHVSYLEAHGTGTELGDPIEVTGLTQAFARDTTDTGFCALGSAKSNLGHLEAAAGIAGLTKVVLQFRHGQLAPSLHAGVVNPKIPFAKTPFHLQQALADWVRPDVSVDGQKTSVPRIAGVSSFGAGGSNAHVLLQEPPVRPERAGAARPGPVLVVLSAKTAESLAAYAEKLETFLATTAVATVNLHDLAFTLQTGREAMEERLGLVVASVAELREKLTAFRTDPEHVAGVHRDRVPRGNQSFSEFADDEDLAATIATWRRKGKWDRIAAWWVRGGAIDWDAGHDENPPRRIALPTYPFARERYWVDVKPAAPVSAAQLHPLVQTNVSDLQGLGFQATFSGHEFFLADHVVKGVKVLPGVAYLEMARFAAHEVSGAARSARGRTLIRNVVWARPLMVADEASAVHVRLAAATAEGMSFSISSAALGGGESGVHSQGWVTVGGDADAPTLDVAALRAGMTGPRLAGSECYAAFEALGMNYGAGFQALQEVFTGGGQVLARLALPSAVAAHASDYGLHPSLLDGALQACIGLSQNATAASGPAVPFALDELEMFPTDSLPGWVWVRSHGERADSAAGSKWDLTLCDDTGRIGVELRGLTFRPFDGQAPATDGPPEDVLLAAPMWREQAITVDPDVGSDAASLVLLVGRSGPSPETVAALWPEATCVSVRGGGDDPGERFTAAAGHVFEIIRERLAKGSDAGERFVQVVIPQTADGRLYGALAGLLKTVKLEDPAWAGQVIALDPAESAEAQVRLLRANRACPTDERIRYVAGRREVLGWRELPTPEASAAAGAPWKDDGVYLLTGGAGGLGLIFAEAIARETRRARLILVGRSALSAEQEQRMAAIRRQGAEVRYHGIDLTRRAEVESLIEGILAQEGRLDGVLHAAGLVRDHLMANKTPDEFRAVLAPKVTGTVNLDHACRALDLDFLALFAAGAGVVGNPGQADYATANAFLDAFAEHRNERVAAGERRGRTLAVDWPWWEAGGMKMDAITVAAMRTKLGFTPLRQAEGVAALRRALATTHDQVLVMKGDPRRLRAGLERAAMPSPQPVAEARQPEASDSVGATGATGATREERTITALRELLSATLRVPVARIHPDELMSDLGIDSVVVMNLTNQLEETLGSLSKTLFFEHQTVRALARHFMKAHAVKLDRFIASPESSPVAAVVAAPAIKARPVHADPMISAPVQATPVVVPPAAARAAGTLDIAVIGLSGRYPQAGNLDEFWRVLREGRDCITEVPPDRWDWRDYYSEDPATPKGHSSKWGGFIADVDKFDPQFFNISPRIAPYLDPQERLILEETWKAVEDAGYRREDLQQGEGDEAWSPVGVYMGAMYGEYQLLGAEASLAGQRLGFAGNLASIANRVSYLLNLHGPSMMVDTMCSSSLTCIHLACQDLVAGRTNYAIAGGVNVTIHPNKYLMLSGGQFLSAAGRCESFGEGGAGYIPSEGVGVAVLKRLADAERDGDHIYGVIKASAVNHGGRTHGYSVPNPKAQEQVISQALREASIDPRAVTYIEAHGTGTKLGDPIEIAGLARAFGRQPADMRCWIGSAKSNIGHCESAAGIAGLTKVLLQMKHRQIAPSLHSSVLNPHIDFASTPFAVNQVLRDWDAPRIDGRVGARIAGVSSFGAGGSNAHLVIEEYAPRPPSGENGHASFVRAPAHPHSGNPVLVIVSAKTAERLVAVVRGLVTFVDEADTTSPEWLAQLAYTLQVGREAMAERLGMIVISLADLREKLAAFLNGQANAIGLARGRVEDGAMVTGLAPTESTALLEHWVKGGVVDWSRFHGPRPPGRISLPTYPFVRKRFWAEFGTSAPTAAPTPVRAMIPAEVATVVAESPVARLRPAAARAAWGAVPQLKPRGVVLAPLPSNRLEVIPPPSRPEPPQPVTDRAPPSVAPLPAPVAAVDRPSLPSDLQAELLGSLAKALFLEEAELSLDKPFLDLGLDSIIGVEWVNGINKKYRLSIPANQVYEYPNLRRFTEYVGGLMVSAERAPDAPAPTPLRPAAPETVREPEPAKSSSLPRPASVAAARGPSGRAGAKTTDIAIIGMAGRFPGGATLDAFWALLHSGETAFSDFPTDRDWDWSRFDPSGATRAAVQQGAFLSDVDRFDPLFFQISPKEAMTMDPAERIFLEESWKAIEDAGIVPAELSGRRWGVFCGNGGDYSLRIHDVVGYSPHVTLAQVPSRVSHCLNLTGPSQSIDASCGSALQAIAQACDQLVMGNCEAALAGGVLVHSTPNLIVSASQVDLLARDGAGGRAFDRRAGGMVPGEAAGVLVLKPLADAQAAGDHVHGVIKGWGSNHNGRTNGMVSPSSAAQEALFTEVYERYEIDPADISMLEANASGLPLADAAEVQALNRVFRRRSGARRFCALGSVENNVGHAFHASGMSHVMKVLLSLRHGQIPGTPNVVDPDPALTLEDSPFFINAATVPWTTTDGRPRQAAVSSFGATGTNVHLVIAESDHGAAKRGRPECDAAETVLITVSAKTALGLKQRCRDLAERLQDRAGATGPADSLRALAANLLLRRSHFEHRCALVVADRSTLVQRLRDVADDQPVTDGFVGVVDPNPRLKPALALLGDSKIDSLAAGSGDPADQLVLADIYVQGVAPAAAVCFTAAEQAPIALPVYPFERRRCWISAPPREASPVTEPEAGASLALLVGFVAEITGLAADEIDPRATLSACGIDSLLGMRLLNRINARFGGVFDASLLVQESIAGMAAAMARQGAMPTAPAESAALATATPGRWVRPKFVQTVEWQVGPETSTPPSAPEGVATPSGEALLQQVIAHGLGVWREDAILGIEFVGKAWTEETLRRLVSPAAALQAELAPGCRYFPVSDMQRLALQESEVARRTTFNLCQAFWIDLPVDREVLQAALDDLVRRHAIFRTGFRRVGTQWMQVVHDELTLTCREICWTDVDSREQFLARLGDYQRERGRHLYDLAQGPMVEVALLHNDADLGAVCFSAHHAHADGFTLFLFQQELFARYTARLAGEVYPETVAQAEYAHFALTQFAPERAAVARFWAEKMAKVDAAFRLSDQPAEEPPLERGTGVVELVIDAAMLQRIRDFNRSSDTTLTQLVTVALATVLHRLAGRCPPVQMVYNLRDRTEFEALLGDFSASAPLVLELADELTLREACDVYHAAALELQQNKHFDFTVLLAADGAGVAAGRVAVDSNDRDAFGGVTAFAERLIDIAMEDRAPVAPLLVCVVKTHGRLTVPVMYDRARFTRRSMELLTQNLLLVVEQTIRDAGQTVGRVDISPELAQRLGPGQTA